MPDKASSDYRGEAAAAAFGRVLEAEAAAEAAVDECRRQAAALLAAARERQRALQGDVDGRMAGWRQRLTEKAEARVAELEIAAARCAEAAELDATAKDRIALAVARLSTELIEGD